VCYDPEADIIVAQAIKNSREHSFFSQIAQNVIKNIGLGYNNHALCKTRDATDEIQIILQVWYVKTVK